PRGGRSLPRGAHRSHDHRRHGRWPQRPRAHRARHDRPVAMSGFNFKAPAPRRSWTATFAFLADAGAVALFVAAGRRTHEESGLAGFSEALRPFLIALLVVWLVGFVCAAVQH